MPRKNRYQDSGDEEQGQDRWLVSYADFITLMFAFFAVLYATSQQSLEKMQDFEDSVRKSFQFGILAGQGESDKKGAVTNPLDSPFAVFPGIQAKPREVQEFIKAKLSQDLTEEEYQELVYDLRHDTVGVKVSLAASALFESGSAELKDQTEKGLSLLASMLKESNRKIIVEGHTDNVPISTAKFPSNWELAAARAAEVVRYLMDKHNVPGEKLAAMSYGPYRPVKPNTNAENRARNRRIEVLVTTDKRY